MLADKKRLVKALSTLIKVKDTHIRQLQEKLSILTRQIDELTKQLALIDERILHEKKFIENDLIFHDDLAKFLKYEGDKRLKLNQKKKIYEQEWQTFYDQLIEHAKAQKSYEAVQHHTKKDIQHRQEQNQRNALDDLILMRHK